MPEPIIPRWLALASWINLVFVVVFNLAWTLGLQGLVEGTWGRPTGAVLHAAGAVGGTLILAPLIFRALKRGGIL